VHFVDEGEGEVHSVDAGEEEVLPVEEVEGDKGGTRDIALAGIEGRRQRRGAYEGVAAQTSELQKKIGGEILRALESVYREPCFYSIFGG